MKNKYDVIVVGAGLAGITCAYKLIKENKKVLLIEKESFLGGRTSSWSDEGLFIESGFHRHIGFYKELPKLLKEVNVNINDIVVWESEAEIKLDEKNKIVLGVSPFHNPITFIKDIIGNKEFLSIKDKISMMKLFLIGFKDYKFNPKELDQYSILEYSKKLNITENVINYIVTSLSTGIFFLPKSEYSAKLFFGIFYPAIFHPISLRIGAYKGGMSEVIIKPIINEFICLGGEVQINTKVVKLLEEDGKIIGVKTNKNIYSDYVVLATDISNAQALAKKSKNKNLRSLLKIPTLSALTVHIELKRPYMPLDRATFSPFTILTSFTEESRTTFKSSKGRLSIIIEDADKYIKLTGKELIKKVIEEFKRIGLDIEKDIIECRVVRHENKFYNFSYGNDGFRPTTDIHVKGLLLAGDYTRQKMYATMEGAVISGLNAYEFIMNNLFTK